jgi:hypothetical protein
VACCLLITQLTPILECEPRFISQVHPCGRTVLKSRLKWSTTWWRWVRFYRRRSVDHWIPARGIDSFSIAYFLGLIVQISVRTNPDDRVVIDEVSIGGRVGPSIGSVVAGCLTAAWNVVAEFLSLWGNSKPIVVVRRTSYSWAGCSRSSWCTTLLIVEPGAQNHRRAPLWITTFRTGTACLSETSRRRFTMSWVHKDESQHFPPSWRASIDVWSSDTWSRIGGNTNQRDQSHVNTRHEVLDWFRPLRGVIVICPVLIYYAIEIDSSLFLSGSFGGFPDCLGVVFSFFLAFLDVLDVDISSLFIVEEPTHIV